MQFLVIGKDGEDAGASARRTAARQAHLDLGDRMKAAGHLLYAAALLDDNERMVGSALVCDFPSRGELDSWLAEEPYVVAKVWLHIEVRPCQVGPSFAK